MKKEYFITYFRTQYPICRDPDGDEIQRSKPCFVRGKCLGDSCEYILQCGEHDECNFHCIADPCPESSLVADSRWRVGELDEEEKEFFLKKTAILDRPGFELQAKEELNLSTIEAKYSHQELIENHLFASYYPIVRRCRNVVKMIWKTRDTQPDSQQLSDVEGSTVLDAVADKPQEKSPYNAERDKRIYELSLDIDMTWQEIADQINNEFGEYSLDPKSAAIAAKRFQEKNNLRPIPSRKPGRKPRDNSY